MAHENDVELSSSSHECLLLAQPRALAYTLPGAAPVLLGQRPHSLQSWSSPDRLAEPWPQAPWICAEMPVRQEEGSAPCPALGSALGSAFI